jgi:hypothetical protein
MTFGEIISVYSENQIGLVGQISIVDYVGDSSYALSLSAVLFQYYEVHQYPICGRIFNPITCIEPSPGLSGNVIQMISLV